MQPQDVAQCVAKMTNRNTIFDPVPLVVKIGRTTYCAAEYRNAYGKSVLYVVGEIPPSYKRSSLTMYLNGENYWYIGFYGGVAVATENQSYWPLGPAFGMFKDQFQYPRTHSVKMKINYTPSVVERGVVGTKEVSQ